MSKDVRRWLFWLGLLFLLGCVVAIVLPAVVCSRERSRRTPCANNLKQLGLGMKMFAGDHDEMFPSKLVDIRRYMADQAKIFICPRSGNKPGTIETVDGWTDYVYISGLSETNSPSEILMYCPIENHGGEGGNILFLDGHVEWFNAEENTSGETSFENAIGTIGEELKP